MNRSDTNSLQYPDMTIVSWQMARPARIYGSTNFRVLDGARLDVQIKKKSFNNCEPLNIRKHPTMIIYTAMNLIMSSCLLLNGLLYVYIILYAWLSAMLAMLSALLQGDAVVATYSFPAEWSVAQLCGQLPQLWEADLWQQQWEQAKAVQGFLFSQHSPYSVIVTYQTVLPNKTHVNIPAESSCPYTQVWIWLSSPIFLYLEPTSLNRHILYTLNYFEQWIPPHVTITVPYPCDDLMERFMQEITTSVS